MKKVIIILFLFVLIYQTGLGQRVELYGSARMQSVYILSSDFNTFTDYYNSVNKTNLPKPRLGYGYKAAAGIVLMNFVFGLSQHNHYLATSGKNSPLANGYRDFDISNRSRNAIVGYKSNGEKTGFLINLEMGIITNIINTGFVYKDGFKSYGNELGVNGSYWVRAFHIGLEYEWQKNIKKNLFLSISGGIHNSRKLAFGKYEDQMEYKRGITSVNYVLYKAQSANTMQVNDEAHLTADFSYLSLMAGLKYQLNIQSK